MHPPHRPICYSRHGQGQVDGAGILPRATAVRARGGRQVSVAHRDLGLTMRAGMAPATRSTACTHRLTFVLMICHLQGNEWHVVCEYPLLNTAMCALPAPAARLLLQLVLQLTGWTMG
jgi:hypothetical protein